MAGPLNLGQCSLHFPLERSAGDWGIRPQEEGQCGQLEQRTQGSLPWAGQGGAKGFLAVPQGPAPRELKMPGCPPRTLLPGLWKHPVLGAGCHLKGQGREKGWGSPPSSQYGPDTSSLCFSFSGTGRALGGPQGVLRVPPPGSSRPGMWHC